MPGCEKNKGSILARTVTYINDLKAKEHESGEKKSMEKTILEQAVQALEGMVKDLQGQLQASLEDNVALREKIRVMEGGGLGEGGEGQ